MLTEEKEGFTEVIEFGPGQAFGEVAMVSSQGKYLNTFKARTELTLACLD